MSEQPNNASLLDGHRQLAQATIASAIGGMTGAESWKTSGESTKQAGIDQMKAAGESRDPNQSGYGKVEEMAGKAFGCEGMQDEGAQSKKQ